MVLVPNTSHAFCRVLSAAFKRQKIQAVPLEIGREEAIRLGKQYVHNDICFPAQIVIGEILAALKSGQYDIGNVAVGMGKYVGDCRLMHYSALLRKAMDDAGFRQVPILTNDDKDYHNLHPGYRMNLSSAIQIAFTLPMMDVLEQGGIRGAARGFEKAVALMKDLDYDRSRTRPQVLIVGEYLLNFHPGANHDIEAYLEENGFEVIEARMTDVIQKTYFNQDTQIKEYHLKKSVGEKAWYRSVDIIFNLAHELTDKIAAAHPLYTPACRMQDIVILSAVHSVFLLIE